MQKLLISFLVLTLFFLNAGRFVQAQEISAYENTIEQKLLNNQVYKIEVDFEGLIKVSDNDRSLKSISRGGFVRIRSISFGNRRELFAESDANGNLNYDFLIGGKRADFNRWGKGWLADVLIKAIRTSGLAAAQRVDRIWTQGGVKAVLNEISKVEGDYVATLYLNHLIPKVVEEESALALVAEYIPVRLKSDQATFEILEQTTQALFKNEKTIEAFMLSALDEVESEFHVYGIIEKALRRDLNHTVINKILENVGEMETDLYKASILDYLIEDDLMERELLEALKVVETIDSDRYKFEILRRGCARVSSSSQEAKATFRRVAKSIRSNTYFGRLLRCIDSEITD